MVRDEERDHWLDHLRAWGEAPAQPQRPAHGTNWQRLNNGPLEQAAHVTPGCLTRWWSRRSSGRAEARITRADYLKLCPWLVAWYGYEPPTSEWQFL